jgi:hypothetical protein
MEYGNNLAHMKNPFRANKLIYGVLIGALLALASFGIFFWLIETVPIARNWFTNPKIPFLLALVPNLLVMRIYFINLKIEKAAQGILLITFVGVLLVFFLV